MCEREEWNLEPEERAEKRAVRERRRSVDWCVARRVDCDWDGEEEEEEEARGAEGRGEKSFSPRLGIEGVERFDLGGEGGGEGQLGEGEGDGEGGGAGTHFAEELNLLSIVQSGNPSSLSSNKLFPLPDMSIPGELCWSDDEVVFFSLFESESSSLEREREQSVVPCAVIYAFRSRCLCKETGHSWCSRRCWSRGKRCESVCSPSSHHQESQGVMDAAPSPAHDDRGILIIDNGAHTIKALWSNDNAPPSFVVPSSSFLPRVFRSLTPTPPCSIFPNSITRSKTEKRTYVSDELDECRDFGGLFMKLAFERVSELPFDRL